MATGPKDESPGELDTVEPLDLDDIEALADGETQVQDPGKGEAGEPIRNLQSKLRGLEQEFGATLEQMNERLREAEEIAKREREARKQLEADARSRLREAHDNLEGIQDDLDRTRRSLESSEARFLELQHILDDLVSPETASRVGDDLPEDAPEAEAEADADDDAETVFEVVDPEGA